MARYSVKEVGRITRLLYHPSLDVLADLGVACWPSEEGGHFLGSIDGECALPHGFIPSENLSREFFNGQCRASSRKYVEAARLKDIPGDIGGAHTHPERWRYSLDSPSYYAGPSVFDANHVKGDLVPFEVIALVFEGGPVYTKAFGPNLFPEGKMKPVWEEIGVLAAVSSPRTIRKNESGLVGRAMKELKIFAGGRDYAGVIYAGRHRIFVDSDAEADYVIKSLAGQI